MGEFAVPDIDRKLLLLRCSISESCPKSKVNASDGNLLQNLLPGLRDLESFLRFVEHQYLTDHVAKLYNKGLERCAKEEQIAKTPHHEQGKPSKG